MSTGRPRTSDGTTPVRPKPVWTIAVWAILVGVIAAALVEAAASPLLAWRQPIYIAAGFAGVVGLALLLVQPLLAGGSLPGLGRRAGRRLHGWIGAALVVAVLIHLGGLWIVSPPDVVDALLFRSPTPFSAWGVIALIAVLAAAGLAALRRRLGLRLAVWRLAHMSLAAVIVVGTVVHALLIEGTMGTVSKVVLCGLVVAALVKVWVDVKPWTGVRGRRRAASPP